VWIKLELSITRSWMSETPVLWRLTTSITAQIQRGVVEIQGLFVPRCQFRTWAVVSASVMSETRSNT
jgi:hypothetical protein